MCARNFCGTKFYGLRPPPEGRSYDRKRLSVSEAAALRPVLPGCGSFEYREAGAGEGRCHGTAIAQGRSDAVIARTRWYVHFSSTDPTANARIAEKKIGADATCVE